MEFKKEKEREKKKKKLRIKLRPIYCQTTFKSSPTQTIQYNILELTRLEMRSK